MRILLYIVILGLLFLAPVERLDVAMLEPVQTVAVSVVGNTVILQTDTDNAGSGADAAAALLDLENTTPGVIYLDTAEYLLVTEDALNCVDTLRSSLSPSVKVSLWDGQGSVRSAAKYLGIRRDLPMLRDWSTPAKKVEKFQKNILTIGK